jgi:hypothetical protein
MEDTASRFPKFAKRLADSCDNHAECPPLHKGRQVWLKDRLAEQGLFVSIEGIRKWLAGETRPRDEKAEVLGRVLGVNPVWLRTGARIASAGDPGVQTAPPLQVGLRPGISVDIRGLPLDLNKSEAEKLANIILAHAAE